MISHRETRLVPYPAELMYAVVSDVEHYPQFLPWVVALRVLSRRDDGLIAEMAVGYGALRERYTSESRLDPAARTIDVVEIKGPFKHWKTIGASRRKAEGCEVDFSIALRISESGCCTAWRAASSKKCC